MKNKLTLRNYIVFIAVLLSANVSAQENEDVELTQDTNTIAIPVGTQGNQSHIAVPSLGMNMNAVRSGFGDPERTLGPVGSPPITTWIYPSFSVYFERDIVIHSVIEHKSPQ